MFKETKINPFDDSLPKLVSDQIEDFEILKNWQQFFEHFDFDETFGPGKETATSSAALLGMPADDKAAAEVIQFQIALHAAASREPINLMKFPAYCRHQIGLEAAGFAPEGAAAIVRQG
jgi:hypothetical protein